MAISSKQIPSQIHTYEDYMAEGEINRRYDIIDGERIFMPNPTGRHQDILLNIARLLQDYQRVVGRGRVRIAAADVLITRQPLRTRQPDVLFISNARLQQCAPSTDPAPLTVGPEIVVEILSPSETRKMREEKIKDYQRVNVSECWIVDISTQTVEILRLSAHSVDSVATYSHAQTLQSISFSDLTVSVADIFRI